MKNMSHIGSQRLSPSYIFSSSFSSHKFLTETFCNTATKTKFVVILDSYNFFGKLQERFRHTPRQDVSIETIGVTYECTTRKIYLS